MSNTLVLIEGFLTGATLIIAIGPQNSYVLRQGLTGGPVFLITSICFLGDAILIALGGFGLGGFIASSTSLRKFMSWFGAAFLAYYSIQKYREVSKAQVYEQDRIPSPDSISMSVITITALTFLNPHVYVDSILLLGGISAQHELSQRYYFIFGAISASAFWFYSLGYGARTLAPLLSSNKPLQILDTLIIILMLFIASKLVVYALS